MWGLIVAALVPLAGTQLPPTVPQWQPTYNMSQSTIVMPCNFTSWMGSEDVISKFGIVDYDWSNAKQLWAQGHPMDCEERLVEQAKRRKAAACPTACPFPRGCLRKSDCPHAKVWVYRNLVKALPWFTSVRQKLDDPQYSGFFLKFDPRRKGQYHSPQCDHNFTPPKCSDLYHDQVQTPGYPKGDGACGAPCDCGTHPCGEYAFDHRNGSMLTDFLVREYVASANGVLNPNVDGVYIDDAWARGMPSEMDPHAVADMGLSPADGHQLHEGWAANMRAVQRAILAAGAYNWQLMGNSAANAGPLVKPATCTADLRWACGPAAPWAGRPLMYGVTRCACGPQFPCHYAPFNVTCTSQITPLPAWQQDLAAFLLLRGPFAWLGYSWIDCADSPDTPGDPVPYWRPPEMDVDYGVPRGVCAETAPGTGVFVREWTKAAVQFDCNTFTGRVVRTGDPQ